VNLNVVLGAVLGLFVVMYVLKRNSRLKSDDL
jgi:hypothetical protein